MKKTVLFLMNGFGIEQKDSYSVYNSTLMPNLDKYTKEHMFSTITTPAFNIGEGYRLFSTGSMKPLTYSLLDNYVENFGSIKNLEICLNSIKENSKIQLFLCVENEKCFEHLKAFVRYIRTKKNNPIFLHLIMTSLDINNYKEIEKIIDKVNYEFKEVQIATIIGLNTITGTYFGTYMNMLKNEIGEKWREIAKKINSLVSLKISPRDAKEMYVNNGFKLEENDTFFFLNYESLNLTNFINNVSQLGNFNYYSMFPITSVKYAMLGYPKSGISMHKSLEKIGANALILTSSYSIPIINYYCNGLQNVVSERINFANIVDNFSKIKEIIDNSPFDLIIIDYQIDGVTTIEQLNNSLKNLDNLLGYVHDYCILKKYSLFISSLYGMKKEIKTDNHTNSLVNFSTKVPFIVVDNVFKGNNYTLSYGSTYNLAHTLYTNINNKYEGGEVLIKRKSYVQKMLKK